MRNVHRLSKTHSDVEVSRVELTNGYFVVTSIFNSKREAMMKLCGIYAIVNKVNGKRYVGKSSSILTRWSSHLAALRSDKRNKDCNRYLYNSFKKYGESNFGLEFLEIVDNPISDKELSELELQWMIELKTLDRAFGYNLRSDSSSKSFVHDDTRRLISNLNKGENNPNFGNKWSDEQKQRMSDDMKRRIALGRYTEETRKKQSVASSKFWRENPEVKLRVKKLVVEKRSIYSFEQYTKEGQLVRIWNNMDEILTENPDYHSKAIYGCCSGYKKSYRGFLWKKSLKI